MIGLEHVKAGIQGAGSVIPSRAESVSGAAFGGLFQSLVQQTGTLDKKAQDAVTGLLDGSGVEVHEAMIATQKADMAFELALQVRNKAVGAYQQMMSMQF
jgi:flagellar hook-basal body complex protein FliE